MSVPESFATVPSSAASSTSSNSVAPSVASDALSSAEIDLTSCDREPIHILGAIQPFGALLVLDGDNLRIIQASANTKQLFGMQADSLLEQPLSVLLKDDDIAELKRVIESEEIDDNPIFARLLQARPEVAPTSPTFRAILHRRNGVVILELESTQHTVEAVLLTQFYSQLRTSISRIQATANFEELAERTAREVRRITGFDKVMIYRFDEEWNGTVIAEAKAENIESFMGFRFPASDIPRQARHLYVLNRVRIIADVADERVPMVPQNTPTTGGPLDMSYVGLRSVSPVHIEYLRNMKVRASMSISIVKDNQLWGLIACHHSVPRPLNYETRAAAEFLGQVLAQQLAATTNDEFYRGRLRTKEIVGHLMAGMAVVEDFVDALHEHGDELLELVNATGAALLFEGKCVTVGKTPPPPAINELIEWIEGHIAQTEWSTTELRYDYPKAAEWSKIASGLLMVSISQVHRSYVLWFRAETAQTIEWGGDPRKPVEPDANGLAEIPANERRLHPRRSFEAWRETVEGKSLPWQEYELEAANELRSAIIGIALKRAEEMAQLTGELERSNRELESFSYSVSHDLRAPFRHITGFAALLKKRLAEDVDATSMHYINTISEAAHNAGVLVDNLLGFSRMARAEMQRQRVDMNVLVQDARAELESEIGDRDIEWILHPLPPVTGDRTMLQMVVRNLVGNAVKYTSKREHAVIEIGTLTGPAATKEGAMRSEILFYVRDNGVGFDMQYADKIFGVFQRLHTVDEFEGTGIGLANVQRAVLRHGGRVWAQAVIDEGTTLYFTLPRRQSSERDNIPLSEQLR